MGVSVKLIERVCLVGSGRLGVSLSSELDCHVYLVDDGKEAALIDAGAGVATAEILAVAAAHGFPSDRIRHLLLTHGHADHAGGTASFRRHLPLFFQAEDGIRDLTVTGVQTCALPI